MGRSEKNQMVSLPYLFAAFQMVESKASINIISIIPTVNKMKETRSLSKGISRKFRPFKKNHSTKNNLHHFGSVIKKFLYQSFCRDVISYETYSEVTLKVLKATSLKKFVEAFYYSPIRLLQESASSG
jgi:hypothetical protein